MKVYHALLLGLIAAVFIFAFLPPTVQSGSYEWIIGGALPTGTVTATPTPTPTPTRTATVTPTPTPTPTPAAGLIGAYDWVGENDGGALCPTTLPANAVGCAIAIKWARVEPQSGQFDWSYVDNILTHGYPIQLTIQTGMAGTPDAQAVCDSLVNPQPTPTCQPWLSSITGVTAHWVKPGQSGYNGCTNVLLVPSPADAAYVSAYRGLLAEIDRKFKGNAQISYINIAPMSFLGNDISLGVSAKSGNTCGITENYSPQWATISGCGTGTGADACFLTWINNAFAALWNGSTGQQVLLQDVPQSIAMEPQMFPSLQNPGSNLNATQYFTVFTDALNHQPSPGTLSLYQEGMNNTANVCNLAATAQSGNPAATGGIVGQAVSKFSTCTQLCQAGITFGAYKPPAGSGCGTLGMQVYNANFAGCSSSIAKMNLAYNGTAGETCP